MTVWLVVAAVVLGAVPGSRAAQRTRVLARAGRLTPTGVTGPRRAPHARSRVAGAVCTVGGMVGGARLGGIPLAVAGGAITLSAWLLLRRAADRRAADAARDLLLRAVRLMIAEFDAGSGTGSALAAAAGLGGPHGPAFTAATSAAERGTDPAAALLEGPPAVAVLGYAVRLAERTGAPPGRVLGHVAADLAAEREQQRAVSVALAGPRASAALLSGLPVLGIVLGSAMAARPLHLLLDSASGRVLACVGVLLDVAGVWWIAGLLRRAQLP